MEREKDILGQHMDNFTFLRKVDRGRNLDEKTGFWELEEPQCLYRISEQKFRHRSASTAALFLDLIILLQ